MPGMSTEQRAGRIAENCCVANLSCRRKLFTTQRCRYHHQQRLDLQNARRAKARTARSERSTNDRPLTPRAPIETWKKLIWVSFPDEAPLDETASLAIQFYPEDRETLGHDSWLDRACPIKMHNTVKEADDGSSFVHQGLVTLLALEDLSSIAVEKRSWEWLAGQLKQNLLSRSCRDDNGQPLRSILFLHWTTDEPTKPNLDAVYDAIRLLKHTHGTSFRGYPNESEAWQERAKLGDIRALDDIARSSPPEFSYRPKTCFGDGPCQLADQDTTVHKRNHSAVHVHVRARGERHQLTCDPGASSPKPLTRRGKGKSNATAEAPKKSTGAEASGKSVHWFHQEYVPALKKCEFRVFIATEPSANPRDRRGRVGRVIKIAKTAFDKNSPTLAVREFLSEDIGPSQTHSNLVDFALFVFEALRARADSMTVFESLEVGVRLDIGMAEDGAAGKKFFVNEITRWYGAHYFSHNICAGPKTQICWAFAKAFDAYINDSMEDRF